MQDVHGNWEDIVLIWVARTIRCGMLGCFGGFEILYQLLTGEPDRKVSGCTSYIRLAQSATFADETVSMYIVRYWGQPGNT